MEPRTHAGDSAVMRVTFDRGSGSDTLEQRVLRFGPGRSAEIGPEDREEALFVLDGSATLVLDGGAREVEPGTAVLVAPGVGYRVENLGPAELALVDGRGRRDGPPSRRSGCA